MSGGEKRTSAKKARAALAERRKQKVESKKLKVGAKSF
jgi:hypothetical protein